MWTFFVLLVTAQAYDCAFKAPDGAEYDLSPLRRSGPPDFTVRVGADYEYRTNLCTPTFQSCNGDPTGIATQWNLDGSCVSVLGRQSPVFGGSNPPVLDYIDRNDHSVGVTLKYVNGDVCIDEGFLERSVMYNIRCAPDEKGAVLSATEYSPCQYQIDIISKAGCLPASRGSLSDNSTRQRSKAGNGTWLLLSLAIGLSLYCGLGIYINKKRHGLELLESIPHKEFWQEVPNLVREGAAFTIAKLRRWKGDNEGRVSI